MLRGYKYYIKKGKYLDMNGSDSPAPATFETPSHSGSKGCERASVLMVYASISARYEELVD